MNISEIAERVACRCFFAKERPGDEFAGQFFDLREKIKTLKDTESSKVQENLQNSLINDLRGKGVVVSELKVSLGQYRGSKFVTSGKLTVRLKDEAAANSLLTYLKGKWSPKYKLKSVEQAEGGVVANYNVR